MDIENQKLQLKREKFEFFKDQVELANKQALMIINKAWCYKILQLILVTVIVTLLLLFLLSKKEHLEPRVNATVVKRSDPPFDATPDRIPPEVISYGGNIGPYLVNPTFKESDSEELLFKQSHSLLI